MPRSRCRLTRTELAFIIGTQVLVSLWTFWILSRPLKIQRDLEIIQGTEYLNELAIEYQDQYQRWPSQHGGVWELAISGLIDYQADRLRYQFLSRNYVWDRRSSKFVWHPVSASIHYGLIR